MYLPCAAHTLQITVKASLSENGINTLDTSPGIDAGIARSPQIQVNRDGVHPMEQYSLISI